MAKKDKKPDTGEMTSSEAMVICAKLGLPEGTGDQMRAAIDDYYTEKPALPDED